MKVFFRSTFLLFAAALLFAPIAFAQTPSQNVNMVSGVQWPGGDPFLQRQNEPSIAVSSRNPRHLLAGANDYRTVDVPFADVIPGSMAGDAWLSIFKSFNGGQTWQSTLMPGYPQDTSPEGMASPLKGFVTGADPTVRAGTHGLFYYSGIAFNRGTNQGVVFVARFMDLANKENGDLLAGTDPMPYLGASLVDVGTSGQFIDKPWIAVDIARPGAKTCTIPVSPTQSIPAGMVYIVWSRFTGSNSTKIMFSRSDDCGMTWSNPVKLSESNSINQGTTIAVDPTTGEVYVAWRRFSSSSETNAILVTKSSNLGKNFPKAKEITAIIPFDQGTTSGSFRTSALPALAVSVDSSNVSRAHVAWADRLVPNGDSRIVMTTSADGVNWSTPAAVDPSPITDDFGGSFGQGHQFMPALTFTEGKLMVLYYDSRLTHTASLFTPNGPDPGNGCLFFCPDAEGDFYQVQQNPKGELLTNPSLVHTPFLTDTGLTLRRHTLDLIVSQTNAGNTLNFSRALVSQYKFGLRGDEMPGDPDIDKLKQLQVDPPGFPMFQNGTVPFIGDYIDIAGQMFLANPDGTWRFNIAPTNSPEHYAVWTSNRDVRPPADGNWAAWTPPTYPGSTTSIFDPTQQRPTCVTGREGMRNQNIYVSRITQGLVVTSPQNSKPLSPTLKRAFVVLVKNDTDLTKHFRMAIGGNPAGGDASWLPDMNSVHALDVSIAPHSGIVRTVQATASDPAATIAVNVTEIASAPGGAVVPGGLAGFVLLNADRTIGALDNPDGIDPATQDIAVVELYTPNISNPNISNPNISNPNISNPNISNPNISNPNISNPNISNPDIADPNISNPNISNPNISNPNISNPNISNPNISNSTLTDATYEVVNSGNTSTGYTVRLIGNQPPTGTTLQMIVTKPYLTPISVDCTLQQETNYELLSNVNDPVVTDPSQVANPNLLDPSTNNATFWLAPGERAFVTLRANVTLAGMGDLTSQLAPDAVAQPQNEGQHEFAIPLIITTVSLPNGFTGAPYSATVMGFGGLAPYTWSIADGMLPDGLTLDATTGEITGAPTQFGNFNVTIQATDSNNPQRTATRVFVVMVAKSSTSVSITTHTPYPSGVGQQVAVSFTVTANPANADISGETLTVSDDLGQTCSATVAAGTCNIILNAAGTRTLTASFPDSSQFGGSTSDPVPHLVQQAQAQVVINVGDLEITPTVVGEPITVQVNVGGEFGGPVPTGNLTVTIGDGSGETCTAPLIDGQASCSITPQTSGDSQIVVAIYDGDNNFVGGTDTVTHTVEPAATSIAILSSMPNPSTVGESVTVGYSLSVTPPGSGTPTGTVTVSGDGLSCNGPAPSGSCSITFTSAGTKTLAANYAGDGNYLASTSAGAEHVVEAGNTTTGITMVSPASSVTGQPITVSFTVAVVAPAMGMLAGTVTVNDGTGASCSAAVGAGSCVLTPTSAGMKMLTASFAPSGGNFTSSSGTANYTVNQAGTTTTITSDSPDPSTPGQSVTVNWTVVVNAPGAGTRTGTVTVTDGNGGSCSANVSAGACMLAIATSGAKTLTATYSGDANFLGSSDTEAHTVQIPPFVFNGFLSPLSAAGTFSNPSTSPDQKFGSGVPLKWELRTQQGVLVTDLSAVIRVEAWLNTNCAGAPESFVMNLYSPTQGGAGGSTFRVSNGQFIFNWDTTSVASTGRGCYTVVVKLTDGTDKATTIRLK